MTTLQNALLNGVPHGIAKRVMVGINWTMVEGNHGCGLAQTPQRNSPGCQPITAAGQLDGMDLRHLANLIKNMTTFNLLKYKIKYIYIYK